MAPRPSSTPGRQQGDARTAVAGLLSQQPGTRGWVAVYRPDGGHIFSYEVNAKGDVIFPDPQTHSFADPNFLLADPKRIMLMRTDNLPPRTLSANSCSTTRRTVTNDHL